MPGRPEGATVTLTYDLDGTDWTDPTRGDLLLSHNRRTDAVGTAYLVLSARRVRSQVHPRRFSLRCLKLSLSDAAKHLEDATIYPLYWYTRKRKARLR